MITFTGDLYLGDSILDFEDLVLSKIIDSDFIISNFENVLRNDTRIKRVDKSSNLQFTKKSFESYVNNFKSKFVFTLGNNHLHDLGSEGVLDTIDFLGSYKNVIHTGIGKLKDVIKPLIIEENNKKIAFLCVSTNEPEVMSVLATDDEQGVLDYNDCVINHIIEENKKLVDYLVILPHWGKEFVDYPSIQQRQKAYKWIDAGADLIIGHHPHVIQGKENYRGKWIYYSLGNYIFPNFFDKNGIQHKWNKENNKSIMLNINFAEVLIISEVGLCFDTTTNILSISNISTSDFYRKSEVLNIDKVPLKKYFGLWQMEHYRILKHEYSFVRNLLLFFPKHKNHSRLGYFFHRLKTKLINKWI